MPLEVLNPMLIAMFAGICVFAFQILFRRSRQA